MQLVLRRYDHGKYRLALVLQFALLVQQKSGSLHIQLDGLSPVASK